MEIKPVSDNVRPGYPLKYELKEETLKAKIPKRWTQNVAAKVALGALAVVALTGCAPEVLAGVEEAITPPTEASVSVTPIMPEGLPTPSRINVAPLFIHGEGRGTYGCDMVTSPAYLSEAEALTVINEVAKEYGLEFSGEDKAEFSTVLRPVTYYREPDAGVTAPPEVFITLKTDFSDNKHGVALEFVSVDDVKSWCKQSTGIIDQYDIKDAAAQLSESLDNAWPNGIYTAGVLYDPYEAYRPEDASNQNWEEAKVKEREISEEQLKAQAKDFFEWLKQQGVI